ncbi:MAG: hypothetical protein JW724_03080 [Candidatus Altiarchaeota archaeon]|nr:hypothetical protein [Candidatus Altiarchaeota archaeon]
MKNTSNIILTALVLSLCNTPACAQSACSDGCNMFSDFEECPGVCPPKESLAGNYPAGYPDGNYLTVICDEPNGIGKCVDPVKTGEVDEFLQSEIDKYGNDVLKFYACKRNSDLGYTFAGFSTSYYDGGTQKYSYGCTAGRVCCMPVDWCEDPDGVDIMNKNTCRDSRGVSFTDKCIISDKLIFEGVCVNWFVTEQCRPSLKVCPEGYECVDGACVDKTLPAACSDSVDGGFNIYSGGTCIDNEGYVDGKRKYSTSKTERCLASGELRESYCQGFGCVWETLECPEGYVCEKDRCVEAPQPNVCDDEDNLDYYRMNTCIDNSGEDYGERGFTDMCSSKEAGKLYESYCAAAKEACDWTTHYCPSGKCESGACADCNDPDGEDVNNKGVCMDYQSNVFEDRCDESDKSYVIEAVCEEAGERTECAEKKIDCPQYNKCVDGACVTVVPAVKKKSCVNKDEGEDETDPYTKGTCWQNRDDEGNILEDMTVKKEDFCTNELSDLNYRELLDYYCDAAMGVCEYKIITCEDFDMVCDNGVCIPTDLEGKCTNEGEGLNQQDPFTKGVCTSNKNERGLIMSKEPTREFADACSTTYGREKYFLKDYRCDTTTGRCITGESGEIDCRDYGMVCIDGACVCPDEVQRREESLPVCEGNSAYPERVEITESTYVLSGEECVSSAETHVVKGTGTDCTPLEKICINAGCVPCESLGMEDCCGGDGKTLYRNYHFSQEAALEFAGRTDIDTREYCRFDETICEYGCDPVKKECRPAPEEPVEEDKNRDTWAVIECSFECIRKGACWVAEDQPFTYHGVNPCASPNIIAVCENEKDADGCTVTVEYKGTNTYGGRPREKDCDCGVEPEPEPVEELSCTNNDAYCPGGEKYCRDSATYTDAEGTHELLDICDAGGGVDYGKPAAILKEASCLGDSPFASSIDCTAEEGFICLKGACVQDCRKCGNGLLDQCDRGECEGKGEHCVFTPALFVDLAGSCDYA